MPVPVALASPAPVASAPSPPADSAPRTRIARPDPLLTGLAGVLVAGWHVGVPALWRDEVASVGAAERTWSALGGMVQHVDAVHAVYYAFLHLWFAAVGFTPVTLRLPSVLAAGGTAAIVTVLGARLGSRRAGLAAGAVAAVLPSLVWAGGEGRSYAISALLASAATLALVHALGRHRSRASAVGAWTGYAALLALTSVVFLDALLLAGAHVVTALLLGRGRQRLAAVGAAVAAALAATPLIRLASAQGRQVSWIARLAPPTPWHQLAVEQWFRADGFAAGAALVLAGGALFALLHRRAPAPALAVALPWALLPPIALVTAGLVHAPVYWPRYVTFTAPAVALLIGLAAAALPRLFSVLAVVLLAALAVPQILADRAPRAKADSELGLAAALVAHERRPSDGPSGILYGKYGDVAGSTTRLAAIAYPAEFHGLVDLRLERPLAHSTVLFGANIAAAATPSRMTHLRTVWILLDPRAEPPTAVPAAAMRAIGLHESGRYVAPGSLLLRWSR